MRRFWNLTQVRSLCEVRLSSFWESIQKVAKFAEFGLRDTFRLFLHPGNAMVQNLARTTYPAGRTNSSGQSTSSEVCRDHFQEDH